MLLMPTRGRRRGMRRGTGKGGRRPSISRFHPRRPCAERLPSGQKAGGNAAVGPAGRRGDHPDGPGRRVSPSGTARDPERPSAGKAGGTAGGGHGPLTCRAKWALLGRLPAGEAGGASSKAPAAPWSFPRRPLLGCHSKTRPESIHSGAIREHRDAEGREGGFVEGLARYGFESCGGCCSRGTGGSVGEETLAKSTLVPSPKSNITPAFLSEMAPS